MSDATNGAGTLGGAPAPTSPAHPTITSLVTLGMNDKHLSLRDEFLRRLHSILSEQELRMKSYAIAEDWSKNIQETVALETPSFTINLQVTARTK